MKNKTSNIPRIGTLLSLITITSFCIAGPVHAGNSTAPGHSKPPHGGGPGGGGTGGGPTNVFYPTATNDTQLLNDINYANQLGGTYTIYLQPNTTFTGGGSIGGTRTVNLTIIGNGDTFNGPGVGQYLFRFFTVAAGSSLTLQQMTLQNGCVYANYGGAIYNSGTLMLSNCTISRNTSIDRSDYVTSLRGVGGAIYNSGGTVIIENSILSDNLSTGANPMGGAIYNASASGTVKVFNSIFTNNVADGPGGYTDPEYPASGEGGAIFNESGTVTISHSILTGNYALFMGGGICNGGVYYSGGTVTVENSSTISGNTVDDAQNFGTLYLDATSAIGLLEGTPAIPF